MSKVLLASRKEIQEAYLQALQRGQIDLALYWRNELIDRTVQVINDITQPSNPGASPTNSGE